MAKINKKIINLWDGGIKTSSRSSDPNTSDGFQMIKGFDIYKDPKKLIPMQSWESFTTVAERAYGIRAMGGISDTVYGLGEGTSNWLGTKWQYRIKVNVDSSLHTGSLPVWFDMSKLPAHFWSNVNSGSTDVRATNSSHTLIPLYMENIDETNKTGDMWIRGTDIQGNLSSIKSTSAVTTAGYGISRNADDNVYAISFPITFTGEKINVLTLKLAMTGSPSNLIIDLYNDNSGTPGTLNKNLGQIKPLVTQLIVSPTLYGADYNIPISEISLTGTYHIVCRSTTVDSSNFWRIVYQDSGSTTIKNATNSGLTTWGDSDTSATPYYKLSYQTPASFYIYYGNSSATTQIGYGTPDFDYQNSQRSVWNNNQIRFAYTFGDSKGNNKYYTDNDTGGTEALTTDPIYVSGLFGKAIVNSSVQNDSDDLVGLASNDISISFLIKPTSFVSEKIIDLDYCSVITTNTGKIQWEVNGSVASTTVTSTSSLVLNQWNVVDCVFNSDHYIYINGVKETFDTNDGDYDGDNTNILTLTPTTQNIIAQIWGIEDDISEADSISKFNNFTNASFWTVDSYETLDVNNLNFGGVQIWQKSISSGDWQELMQISQPMKNISGYYYPSNSWIDDTGTYFIIGYGGKSLGAYDIAKVDGQYGLDTNFLNLNVVLSTNPSKICFDKDITLTSTTGGYNTFFNYGYSYVGALGSPGSASIYTAKGTVQNVSFWRNYLAVAYTTRNRARVEIWDLVNANPIEILDAGTGNIRIVGSAGDALFCVVDNFIDDAIKSTNKPTMEVRQYVGNGQTVKTHVIEIPAIITGYDDNWERAVSGFKIRRNTQVLFYARLPKDETGTTFNEGLWAIGQNSKGQLSLTLQIDTEGLGMPEQLFGFAQQVFFIKKDGEIKRLSDNTYSNTALITTLKMNEGNTNIEKKLHGVEIVTEPLEAGQTISIYYKINGDTSRTKLGDFTGTGEISTEIIYDENGNNLRNYKEIEFDIESTGGKSAILEFNYRYEYLKDLI